MRAAAVALALVAAVWSGIQVRGATAARDAAGRLARLAPAAGTARLVDRVGTLRPGVDATLLRAQLALQEHRPADARRLLLRAVDAEPDNIEAWTRLAFLARRRDPVDYRRARANILRLAPPVPTGR